MTDQEVQLLCAQALGYTATSGPSGVWVDDYYPEGVQPRKAPWKPLVDGNQAMQVVEVLKLKLEWSTVDKKRMWTVSGESGDELVVVSDPDLKRAICVCAAQIQEWKLL